MSFGFNDTRSSEKPDGFSLSWKPRIVDEKHGEPHLSETNNSTKTVPDRLQKTSGEVGEDVNAPMCPLLPSVKRRKDNQLSLFLEGETSFNTTKLRQEGVAGARFGEGIGASTGLLKKWAETQKTKD